MSEAIAKPYFQQIMYALVRTLLVHLLGEQPDLNHQLRRTLTVFKWFIEI